MKSHALDAVDAAHIHFHLTRDGPLLIGTTVLAQALENRQRPMMMR